MSNVSVMSLSAIIITVFFVLSKAGYCHLKFVLPVYGEKYVNSLIGLSLTYAIAEITRRIKTAMVILLNIFFILQRFWLSLKTISPAAGDRYITLGIVYIILVQT